MGLVNGRFVQDIPVPKFGFQMIRSVIVSMSGDGVWSATCALEHSNSAN